MVTNKTFYRLTFGLTTVFWSFIINILNDCVFHNSNVDITISIMLTLANLIFLQVLFISWKNFIRNTKIIDEKMMETYKEIIEMEKNCEFLEDLSHLPEFQEPPNFKKKRKLMTFWTFIGMSACCISIFLTFAPYIFNF